MKHFILCAKKKAKNLIKSCELTLSFIKKRKYSRNPIIQAETQRRVIPRAAALLEDGHRAALAEALAGRKGNEPDLEPVVMAFSFHINECFN